MSTLGALSPEEAIRMMWKVSDKPERFQVLDTIDQTLDLNDTLFWDTFWRCWTSHESIYRDHELIEDMLDRRSVIIAPAGMEQLDRLPERIEVYRGCRKHNVMGWSWTLDRDCAERFALRAASEDRLPIVLHGLVARERVIALVNDRNESEIVVRPHDVLIHFRERLPKVSVVEARRCALYRDAHEVATNIPIEMTAQMLFSHQLTRGGDLMALRDELSAEQPLLDELGVERARLGREMVRLIDTHLVGA
jgi:hypothetical protein